AEAREAIALVDDEAGGGDHRVPRDDGRLEFGARRVARDVAQVVVAAFRDLGPAVVLAGLDEVELVAAARAHLVRPEAPLGVEGEAEHVAMAHGPELTRHTAALAEGVVVGDAAVVEK